MTSFIDVLMLKFDPNDWILNGSDYSDLVWIGKGDKPTLDYLESMVDEVGLIRAFSSVRDKRDRLLADSDWTQASDAPVDTTAWAEYRQALRDLPANTTDPENPVWPTPPE